MVCRFSGVAVQICHPRRFITDIRKTPGLRTIVYCSAQQRCRMADVPSLQQKPWQPLLCESIVKPDIPLTSRLQMWYNFPDGAWLFSGSLRRKALCHMAEGWAPAFQIIWRGQQQQCAALRSQAPSSKVMQHRTEPGFRDKKAQLPGRGRYPRGKSP